MCCNTRFSFSGAKFNHDLSLRLNHLQFSQMPAHRSCVCVAGCQVGVRQRHAELTCVAFAVSFVSSKKFECCFFFKVVLRASLMHLQRFPTERCVITPFSKCATFPCSPLAHCCAADSSVPLSRFPTGNTKHTPAAGSLWEIKKYTIFGRW